MEKNNTSNSSVCSKIRQALAGNPAVRIINRVSSYHQEPKHATSGSNSTSSSSSPSPANTTNIQTKPPTPQQHAKANTEASGAIPINFVYSTGKGNSSVPNAHGEVAKVPPPFVASSETTTTKVAAKGEQHQPQHVSMQGKPPQHGHGHGYGHGHHEVHSAQQGKKSTDINDTFNEYIERAKKKIRTMSNIGRGQSNTAPDHESHGGAGDEKEHHHKDQFSDFIHHAKKKFRTTTIVGKSRKW